MAVGDILQVKVFQTFRAEPMLNTFYYRVSSGGAGPYANDLQVEFQAGVLSDWQALFSQSVVITQIQVVNGMNNLDQEVQDLTLPGLLAVSGFPEQFAAAFRKRTGGIGFRYSYKRFSGFGFGFAAGEWNILSSNVDLIAFCQSLGAALEGTDGTYTPCQITGGFQLGVTPVFKQELVGEWQFDRVPSHQDTRQHYNWVTPAP